MVSEMISQIAYVAMLAASVLVSIYVSYKYAYEKIGKVGTVVFCFVLYSAVQFYGIMIMSVVVSWIGASNATDYGFGLMFLIMTFGCGLILHAYWMYILDTKYRIIGYPIAYSITPVGFPIIFSFLMCLHFGKYVYTSSKSGYEKANIEKDL